MLQIFCDGPYLIERLLDKDKAKRPQSAHEVLDSLARINGAAANGKEKGVKSQAAVFSLDDDDDTEQLVAPRKQAAKAGPPRMALIAGGAGAALVLLVAVLVFAFSRGGSKPAQQAKVIKPDPKPELPAPVIDEPPAPKQNVPPAVNPPRVNTPLMVKDGDDIDRKVADWALGFKGGYISVHFPARNLTAGISGPRPNLWPPKEKEPVALEAITFKERLPLLTTKDLHVLRQLKHLLDLTFYKAIEPSAAVSLRDLGLRSLDLRDNGFQTEELALPSSLVRVDLSNNPIDDGVFKLLSELPKLESLTLIGTRVTSMGLGSFSHPKLNLVTVNGLSIDSKALQGIGRRLPQLQSLQADNTSITANGLLELPPSMKTLILSKCPVGDEVFNVLNRLPNLAYLSLNGTRVTSQGVASIANQPNLISLGLSEVPLNDEALKDIGRRLPQLRSLYLKSTMITDAGVEYLASLSKLQLLDLFGTNVSAVAVGKLNAANPKLVVIIAPKGAAAATKKEPKGFQELTPTSGQIAAMAFNSDGTKLATIAENVVQIFEVASAAIWKTLNFTPPGKFTSLSWSKDEQWIAAANNRHTVILISHPDGALKSIYPGNDVVIGAVGFDQASTSLFVGATQGERGLFQVYGLADRKLIRQIDTLPSLRCMAINRENDSVLWAGADGKLLTFTPGGQPDDTTFPAEGLVSLAVDGKNAALGYKNGGVFFGADPGRLSSVHVATAPFVALQGGVVAYSGEGSKLITARRAIAGSRMMTISPPVASTMLALSPDGQRLAVLGVDGRIRIWALPGLQ